MMPSDPFEGVPAPLAAAMQRRGFSALTAVQNAVLAAECEGRDLRISVPDGLGQDRVAAQRGRLRGAEDGPRAQRLLGEKQAWTKKKKSNRKERKVREETIHHEEHVGHEGFEKIIS